MPVDVIVPIDTVDEIRVFKDTVVVESFGVDAHHRSRKVFFTCNPKIDFS